MLAVLLQMGVLIACGAAWRIIRPGGLDADQVRVALTTLVFHLLLPALVLKVLWTADLGAETFKISAFGITLILFGAALTWLLARLLPIADHRLGAAMMAIAFGNVTYMGLPVLEQVFGPWARAVAIQIDLFASMPLVITFGIMIARRYGGHETRSEPLLRPLFANPPLWSALIALGFNLHGTALPPFLDRVLTPLATAVIPLMLIALGLGLRWEAIHTRELPLASLVLVLRLLLIPYAGLALASALHIRCDLIPPLVLEAGMPSMLLGIVYCDRYRLDTSFYALAVTLTTGFAMLSLPFWHRHALAQACG